jgi:hypothetical protein
MDLSKVFMKEYLLKGGTDRDVLDSRNAIIQRLIRTVVFLFLLLHM